MNWQRWVGEASGAMFLAPGSSFGDVAACVAVLILILAAYGGRGWVRGDAAPQYARVARERGGVLFRRSLMNAGYWLLQPLGRTLHARHVAPNAITTAGLVCATAAGAAIVLGRLGLAGVALLASALCDALDGMVARLGEKTSESGAAFDAIVDRVEEILVYSAIAYGARAVPWVATLSIFAMTASLMNSYVSAKAEVFRVSIPSGRMRRGERAAWVILGCLLVPLTELTSPLTHVALSSLPLVLCLCVVAVGTAVSAMLRAVALLESLRAHHGIVESPHCREGRETLVASRTENQPVSPANPAWEVRLSRH